MSHAHRQKPVLLPTNTTLSADTMHTPTFLGYITDALPELQGQNIQIKAVPDDATSVNDLVRVGGQILVQTPSQADAGAELRWDHFVG